VLSSNDLQYGTTPLTLHQDFETLSGADLGRLLEASPRESPLRKLFELFVRRWGEFVSYEDLCFALGREVASPQRADGLLMTKVSHLRGRLEPKGFTIECDSLNSPSRGYRLKKRGSSTLT
jgi:hypothetical protein